MQSKTFLVLFISTRRDGRSLGEMAKQELGSFAGVIVMLGALGVMVHYSCRTRFGCRESFNQ